MREHQRVLVKYRGWVNEQANEIEVLDQGLCLFNLKNQFDNHNKKLNYINETQHNCEETQTSKETLNKPKRQKRPRDTEYDKTKTRNTTSNRQK